MTGSSTCSKPSKDVLKTFKMRGEPGFKISPEDAVTLQKGSRKERVVNNDFIGRVQHFRSMTLVGTLSVDAHVVSCTGKKPTEQSSNVVNKGGPNRSMSALVQKKGMDIRENQSHQTMEREKQG